MSSPKNFTQLVSTPAKLSYLALRKNPVFILFAIGILILETWALNLIGSDSSQLLPLSSIIGSIVQIILASLLLQNIERLYEGEKIAGAELFQFNVEFFNRLISAAFILYLAIFVIESLARSLQMNSLIYITYLGAFLCFNALPEALIVLKAESTLALKEAFSFLLRNWLSWFLVFIVFCFPLLLKASAGTLLFFVHAEPLSPLSYIARSYLFLGLDSGLLCLAIGFPIALFGSLFRVFLFAELGRRTAPSSR